MGTGSEDACNSVAHGRRWVAGAVGCNRWLVHACRAAGLSLGRSPSDEEGAPQPGGMSATLLPDGTHCPVNRTPLSRVR